MRYKISLCTAMVLAALTVFAGIAFASTTTAVPTDGVSASASMHSNTCSGQMWACVDDPPGQPDGDTTYVYKDTTSSSGEHILGFSGSITNITGITMHVVAATNGGTGSVQMLFYNNGAVAGTGGVKTLSGTYTEYVSGPFNTQIPSISNLTMKVILQNDTGTGSLKYTAAWLEITYGDSSISMVPTDGVSASGDMQSNACTGEMWNCVNDPVGSPDYDSTYVFKDTSGTSGEHVLAFTGNITNITGITMHIIAATNGGVGTAQMIFYNNGAVAGTGGVKTLTSTYQEYVSGPFSTQISDINNLTMKVILSNTSGSGSLKYTAAWIDVTYGAPTQGGGLQPPSGAYPFANIEEDGAYTGLYNPCTSSQGYPGDDGVANQTTPLHEWFTERDCGTNGDKTGATSSVSSPSHTSTQARQYAITSASTYGNPYDPGIRWSDKLVSGESNADSYTNFQYDVWVYFKDDGSIDRTHALELDINQVTAGQNLYIMAHQCNFDTQVWDVDTGTSWTAAGVPCLRSQFTPGMWHHVQIQVRRDATAQKIIYQKVAIDDGTPADFMCGNPASECTRGPKSSDWGVGTLDPNFQLDANQDTSTGVTVYADQFYIYRW